MLAPPRRRVLDLPQPPKKNRPLRGRLNALTFGGVNLLPLKHRACARFKNHPYGWEMKLFLRNTAKKVVATPGPAVPL